MSYQIAGISSFVTLQPNYLSNGPTDPEITQEYDMEK
jgi:hypothetical protein